MNVILDYLTHLLFLILRVLLDLFALVLSPLVFAAERLSSGPKKEFKSILITGGNSGIGAGLAVNFAAPGVRLVLTARNEENLKSVQEKCVAKGAEVVTKSVDVRNRKEMEELIRSVDSERPLDLVVANAGVSPETLGSQILDKVTHDILDINVVGVVNTVQPAVNMFLKRKRGQVAIMSSIASFTPSPVMTSYCMSKAAVRYYGESLRPLLKKDKIGVSVICPGFVESEMTSKVKGNMPLLMSNEKACAIIRDGLERNKGLIAFPAPMVYLTSLLGGTVIELRDLLLTTMVPRKGSKAFFESD